ncbi:MAG TPA: TonB-dependent receptor [Bryobacteraceae bacterium]|nr:TonB-dependent receptor [Bryobacteraceae bacterium]
MLIRLWVLAALVCACGATAGAQPQQGTERAADEKALLGDLPTVEAVSLHAQTLAEAPANVTVITAAEIRRYGYRTLAEALASVPGFYVTYDHEYHYVGVSGISLPGDFNTRFLVMLNGHPLTDNIYNSNGFFGQDFGLDMDLVERIEIIRGPTSALYGSNGILANINVVTRSPVDAERLRVSAETDSQGERKLSLASSLYLGAGANLLLSGSAFNNAGISVPLNGLGMPPGAPAAPVKSDGERGYHTFANLIWHDWSFTAYFNSRDKQVPVGVGTSFSGDPSQHAIDGRNFIGAVYKHSAGPGELRWQVFYDQYRYQDRYDYPDGAAIDVVRDINRGDWLDSEFTYDLPVAGIGSLTVGVSGSLDLRTEQYNLDDGVRQDYSNHPERGVAVFAQQEWKISARWKLDGGLRLDDTRYFGRALSPRVAAVFQQSPRTVYKLVYGRPFRNPSAFEQFYNDGGLSYAPAAPLGPEYADTFEASMERRLAGTWTVVANGYQYRIQRVIEAVGLTDLVQQYQNASRDLSTGAELALAGKLWDGMEVSASAAFADARGGRPLARLANSPAVISKARLGAPLPGRAFRDRLFVAGNCQYVSARDSWTGARLGGALLADFTLSVRLHPKFDVEAGLRNAFDRRYEDPIYLAIDRLRGDGRSVFVRLAWHARD